MKFRYDPFLCYEAADTARKLQAALSTAWIHDREDGRRQTALTHARQYFAQLLPKLEIMGIADDPQAANLPEEPE